jgi:transcriptional regulator with XRE-family HTH domain
LEHTKQNILGPQIRRIRAKLGISQEMLSARCAVAGWDLSRGTLAKIEAGLRCVTDLEAAMLAFALKTSLLDLYPPEIAQRLKRIETKG